MSKPKADYTAGHWVSVKDELPKEDSCVMTMTATKMMGICYYGDGEFISLMPTPLGEVAYWTKNPEGSDGLLMELEPEPMELV